MEIDIITLFPQMFVGPFEESIIKRARNKDIVEIHIHNLRDWAVDRHGTVDDRPYGGGPGMILRVDVVDQAISKLRKNETKVILLSAKGRRYKQKLAEKLSAEKHLILICGHYEGVDHRIFDLVDKVISIGDFVLTGGELAAMVVVDSIVRLIPGALGALESIKDESFKEEGYIEYPQYTRPEIYKNMKVPEILKSGNHEKIKKWREKNSKKKS